MEDNKILQISEDTVFAIIDGVEIYCDYYEKDGKIVDCEKVVPDIESFAISDYFDEENTKAYVNTKHALQRLENQWDNLQKSDFIRRILWGEPVERIRIDEQVTVPHLAPTRWLVDGLQRYTTIEQFLSNEFKINKNVRRPLIPYFKTLYQMKLTKKGQKKYIYDKNKHKIPLRDEHGNLIKIGLLFDIRGKSFNNLPIEMQKAFKTYQLKAEVRKNATDEIIQNDILDYNNGKQMNKSQIGMTLMGTEWATEINKLSEEYNKFFSNVCGFSIQNKKTSGIKASINEALMMINFFKDWKRDANYIGDYLGKHLTKEAVDQFADMMSCLQKVLPTDNPAFKKGIQSKAFLLMMANYYKFYSDGGDDELYAKFLEAWYTDLVYRKSDEFTDNVLTLDDDQIVSYNDYISKRNTKSINILQTKLEYMNTVMEQWLNENSEQIKQESRNNSLIEPEIKDNSDVNNIDVGEEVLDCIDVSTIEGLDNILPNGIDVKQFGEKVAMLVSNHPNDNINEFRERFKGLSEKDTDDIIDRASLSLLYVCDCLEDISVNTEFLTVKNILAFAKMIDVNEHYSDDIYVPEDVIKEFICKFSHDYIFDDEWNKLEDNKLGEVMAKVSYLHTELVKFNNQKYKEEN